MYNQGHLVRICDFYITHISIRNLRFICEKMCKKLISTDLGGYGYVQLLKKVRLDGGLGEKVIFY